MAGDFRKRLSLREEFHAAFWWLVEHRSTWCLIFLPESVPLDAVFVPPTSSMAAVSKAIALLPRKSNHYALRDAAHILKYFYYL